MAQIICDEPSKKSIQRHKRWCTDAKGWGDWVMCLGNVTINFLMAGSNEKNGGKVQMRNLRGEYGIKNITIIMALWGDAKTNCDCVAGFYFTRITMN